MWRTKMFSIPGVLSVFAIFATVVGASLSFIGYRISTFERDIAGIASEPLDPPQGLHNDGVLAGSPGERTLTISTDAMCPYCVDLFDEHAETLSTMAEGDEWEVRLEVVSIFDESRPSDLAALTLMDLPESAADEVLEVYQRFSGQADGMADVDPQGATAFLEGTRAALIPPEEAEATHIQWLSSISERNRREVGVVPAARVDGEYISDDELESLLSRD